MRILYLCNDPQEKYLEDFRSYFHQVFKFLIRLDLDLIVTQELKDIPYIRVLPWARRKRIQIKPYSDLVSKEFLLLLKKIDAVIIEDSESSFENGYKLNYILKNRKPVLLLSREQDLERNGLQEFINNPFFYSAKYDELTLPNIVRKFIAKAESRELNTKFNMHISKAQKAYIDEQIKLSSISSAEYIRRLIDKDMTKKSLGQEL